MPIGLATLRIIKPTEQGLLRQIAHYGADAVLIRNLAGLTFFGEQATGTSLIGDFSLNTANELTAQLSKAVRLRVGPDILYAPFHSSFAVPEETGPNTPDAGSFLLRPARIFEDGTAFVRPALYAQLEARLFERLELTPGLRLDYTHDTGRVDVSPRISA